MAKNIPSNVNQRPAAETTLLSEALKMKGELSFPDKRKLKEYTSTKPALQNMLKELL